MTTATTRDLGLDRLLTSHEVGVLLQVNPSSINKWVNEGRIPAFRTPGGHRRIKLADLLVFLREHKMPVPAALEAVSKKRVLFVDDNAKHLDALKRLLKKHANRIEAAFETNGIEALLRMGSFKPHVVVLDVYMPGFDGIEVCRRIKQSPEFKNVDVIICSGQLGTDVEKKARAAGARACLEKPIEIDALLAEIGVSETLQY